MSILGMGNSSNSDGESNQIKIDEVNISLTSRSKSFRYLTETAIRERIEQLNGTLFKGPDDYYYLRTEIVQQPNIKAVVIIFAIEESRIEVITQTSDHYDWSKYRHIPYPPFEYRMD